MSIWMGLESKTGGSVKVTTHFSKAKKKVVHHLKDSKYEGPHSLPTLAPVFHKTAHIDKNAQTVENWIEIRRK